MADLPVGFRPTQYDSGQTEKMKMNTSVTISKGDALAFTSGLVRRFTAGDTVCRWVALETKTDDGTNEEILCLRTAGVEFLALTDGTPTQADVGDVVDLADQATVDEDSPSTDYTFEITKLVDATNKIVKGYFHPTVAN